MCVIPSVMRFVCVCVFCFVKRVGLKVNLYWFRWLWWFRWPDFDCSCNYTFKAMCSWLLTVESREMLLNRYRREKRFKASCAPETVVEGNVAHIFKFMISSAGSHAYHHHLLLFFFCCCWASIVSASPSAWDEGTASVTSFFLVVLAARSVMPACYVSGSGYLVGWSIMAVVKWHRLETRMRIISAIPIRR